MKKTASFLAALLLTLAPLTACGEQEHTVSVLAMDTVMELTAYGGNSQAALEKCESRIRELDSLLSVTDKESEIYAANHSGGRPVALSDDTASLLEAALALCAATGGALDVTVYPVVRAWGFTTGTYRVLEDAELKQLLRRVDYKKVRLGGGTLTLPEGMELDLGGVAKGFAGDVLLDLLREEGVESAILSLGGSIHTLGARPDGSPWRVAVRAPEGDGYAGVLEVRDKSVVTSGGYERYFEKDGEAYWHIIDPATGCPARSGVLSATVVGEDGALCDGLSTALFVLGPEKAEALWRARRDFDFVLLLDGGAALVTEGLADSFSLIDGWSDHPLQVVN